MAMFVHITAAKFEPSIRRSGIGGAKGTLMAPRLKRRYVFCFPVVESHTLTHQWSREIAKWRRQPLISVYFRIPDEEIVTCWHLGNRAPRQMSAAKAVGLIRQHEDMSGFEVIVERLIAAKEIHRIAPVRNVIGWRHSPDARGSKPCACEICQRGQPNARRIMKRAERGELRGWFLKEASVKR